MSDAELIDKLKSQLGVVQRAGEYVCLELRKAGEELGAARAQIAELRVNIALIENERGKVIDALVVERDEARRELEALRTAYAEQTERSCEGAKKFSEKYLECEALRADNERLKKAHDNQYAVAGTLLREAERANAAMNMLLEKFRKKDE